jgi:LIVCS family branched-chain amino acid:cation transporter
MEHCAMKYFNKTSLSTGAAIFSMFFGAGNVVFPLYLGQLAGDQTIYALLGLIITGIGGPLLGLMGATLFQGRCLPFFQRVGGLPGIALLVLCFAMLGPLAVLPRCITVAHAGTKSMLPSLGLPLFSVLCAGVTFLCCLSKGRMLKLLGNVLSPMLLVSLFVIIIVGFSTGEVPLVSTIPSSTLFTQGLSTGYDMMDLIAAVFMSTAIWNILSDEFSEETEQTKRKHIVATIGISGLISGILLAMIYTGLSLMTAKHHAVLQGIAPEELLMTLSYLMLGPTFGGIANIAVILACMTTLIGFTSTFTDIMTREFIPVPINKNIPMFFVVASSAAIANLGFTELMHVIHPLISLCYPAIIVLTICNLLYKLYGITMVKGPVFATLLITIIASYWPFV